MNPQRLVLVGFCVILVGFAVVAFGAASGAGGQASTGGFILIGPFPIVFGSGPNSGWLALAGVAITVAVVAMYLVIFLVARPDRRRVEENPNSLNMSLGARILACRR